MFGIWVIGIIVSRVYMFHNAYIHHLQSVEGQKPVS